MGRIRSFLGFLSILFVMLFMPSAHADYSCPTYKKYSSCEAGYYLSECGTKRDGSTITTTYAGNSCESCPDGYMCTGGIVCPRPNTITVSYNLNGGKGLVANRVCDWNSLCSLASVTSTSIYRAGYKLIGWNQDKNATTGITEGEFTANVTLYAIWEKCGTGTYHEGKTGTAANTCTACPDNWTSNPGATSKNECYRNITLNANGGTLKLGTNFVVYDDVNKMGSTWSPSESSQTNDYIKCFYDTACGLPDASGLTQDTSNGISYKFFSGWTITSPEYQNTPETATSVRVTSEAETVTYYASKLPYYTITLNPGDGVKTTGTTKIYAVGNSANKMFLDTDFSNTANQITISKGITTPTKDGHIFGGYYDGTVDYINAYGYAKKRTSGTGYITPNSSLTLTAKWTATVDACGAGQYYDAENSECVSCPAGYPNSVAGSTGIESCYYQTTAGQYVANYKTDYSQVTTDQCNKGFYCPETKVYLGNVGGNQECKDGYTSDAGAKAISDCYTTCAAGQLVNQAYNACTSVSGNRPFWTDEHRVYYGQISGLNYCPFAYVDNERKLLYTTASNRTSVDACQTEISVGNAVKNVAPEEIDTITVSFAANGDLYLSEIELFDKNGSQFDVRNASIPELFNNSYEDNVLVSFIGDVTISDLGYADIDYIILHLYTDETPTTESIVVKTSGINSGEYVDEATVFDSSVAPEYLDIVDEGGTRTQIDQHGLRYRIPLQLYMSTECSGGTFNPAHNYYAGTTDSCAECAIGSYSAAGAGECTACTDGTTTSVTAATSCDTECDNAANAQSWINAIWNTNNTVVNSCAIETCGDGYYLENNTCKPNEYVVTLDKNGGTKDGTTQIFTKYNNGLYSDYARTNTISRITKPERIYTVTFDANGGVAQHETSNTTLAYTGHYGDTDGKGTEYIDSDGNITDDGKNLAQQSTNNMTWYAGWSFDSAADIPSVSERDGYTFDGWKLVGDTTGNLWQDDEDYDATEDSKFIAQWTPVTYTITYDLNGGDNDFDGEATYTVESAFELAEPTRNNSEFIGWYKDESLGGNAITSIAAGTTGNLTLYAGWSCVDGYESATDGQSCVEKAPEITCDAGEYLDGTNCKTCPANSYCTGGTDQPQSCPTDYPYSAAGAKSEEECYTECTTECTKPSSCPQGFQTCTYITGTSVNGVKYKDKSCEFSEGTDCKLNLQKSYCLPGRYMMNEFPYCDNYCADLSPQESIPESVTEPVNGWYTSSSLANITAGPRACSSMLCTPNCNVENSLVLNTDDQNADDYGFVIGTENFCPTNAESCNVKIPTSGNIVYPRLSCIPHSNFCSFKFTCKSGYTPSTTDSVNFGYRTTGSNLTTIYKAKTNASCDPNTYTFVFEQNGGVGGQANSVYYLYNDAWYSDEGKTTKIEAVGRPSKAGYVFDGYGMYSVIGLVKPDVLVTDGDGKILDILDESRVNALGDLKIGDASRTVYAAWTPITYNVAYDANGGSGDAPTEPVSCTYDADCITPKNTYAKTGYTFAGWKCTGGDSNGICDGDIIGEGGSIANATIVNGATIKLTAQWEQNNYAIAFVANKPDAASSDVSGTMANMPMTYDVAKNLTENAYKLTGWTFTGWMGSDGKTYTNGQSVKNLATDDGATFTMTAQWEPNTYTIVFDKNQPANASSDVSGTMANMSMTYDAAKNLTENAYKLTGWTFTGWLGSDGKTYTNGQSVKNLATDDGATFTMTAQWEPNTYEITLDENFDGGKESVIYQKYDTGWYSDENASIDSVSVSDRGTAYKFLGFFDAKEGGTKIFDGKLPNANVFTRDTTLYAHWETLTRKCVAGKYYPRGNDETVAICPKDNYCAGVGAIMGDVSGCNQVCPDNGLTDGTGTINITDCYRNFIEGDEYNGQIWNLDNGDATWKCNYQGSEDSGLYSNCVISISACDGGYYKPANAVTCAQVTNGYYSTDGALTQTQCVQKDNYTVYSDGNRASDEDCFVACSTYTPAVTNATKVELTIGSVTTPHYNNGGYAACQYTVTCKDGYSAQSGTAPACNAKTYTVTLDRNGGNGTAESIECTFDGGKCALPAVDFERTGYVSGNKWCTMSNGGGVCFEPGVAQDFSSTGDDITLYAAWTPGVFKVELVANDATENAQQGPVYLKYATGWYSDKAASKEMSTIGSNFPGKDNGSYVFAGYKLNDVMIVDAAGNLNKNELTVTPEDAVATVVWGKGNTTCPAGTYYSGNGSECTGCPVNSYCPGGSFGTDSGKVGGLNECPKPMSPYENVTIYANAGSENASACNGVFPTYATEYAKGNWKCKYNENTKAYSDCDTDTVSITWCAGGYWYDNAKSTTDCVMVGVNYYSPEAILTRNQCPNGGTTQGATTADSIKDCSKTVDYVSESKWAKGTYVCFADTDNGDKTVYNASCVMDSVNITWCAGGYWYDETQTKTDCVEVGANYYSPEADMNKTACPDGGVTASTTASTPVGVCHMSVAYPNDEQTDLVVNGVGTQGCFYNGPGTGYTLNCADAAITKCDAGYYWADRSNSVTPVCVPVDFGYFGPVADAGTSSLIARSQCPENGITDSDKSADASECYRTGLACDIKNGRGEQTCNWGEDAYDAECTTCLVTKCDDNFSQVGNECIGCPQDHVCKDNSKFTCSELTNGAYTKSDAGTTDEAYCFRDCALGTNAYTMGGRDYFDVTDTCKITMCNDGYTLVDGQCAPCPAGSFCNTASGTEPQSCPAGYPLSAPGANGPEDCFMICEEYKVEYGTAIPTKDGTVYNGETCEYTCISDTGNPGEIANGRCVETSCNYNFEMIGGLCRSCNRENALSYKKTGNCVVESCVSGFHPTDQGCKGDVSACDAPHAILAEQVWDYTANAFSECIIKKCMDGYHIDQNVCQSDVQPCEVENGVGSREWNHKKNTWGECIATSCEPGYTTDPSLTNEQWKQCGRCNNMYSAYGDLAASSYVRECEIAACMHQGEKYVLENNECRLICTEFSDITGSRRWNERAKQCERTCNPGYVSW